MPALPPDAVGVGRAERVDLGSVHSAVPVLPPDVAGSVGWADRVGPGSVHSAVRVLPPDVAGSVSWADRVGVCFVSPWRRKAKWMLFHRIRALMDSNRFRRRIMSQRSSE